MNLGPSAIYIYKNKNPSLISNIKVDISTFNL